MCCFFQFGIFCCGLQKLEKVNEDLQLIDKDIKPQTQENEYDNVTLSDKGTVCL